MQFTFQGRFPFSERRETRIYAQSGARQKGRGYVAAVQRIVSPRKHFPSQRLDIMNDSSPEAFATPRQEEECSTSSSTNGVVLARRTLVLASTASANSTLTADSTTTSTRRTSTSRTNTSTVCLDDDLSDDENQILEFAGESAGPTYMSRCPISNGLTWADIEEEEEEEGDGGDSDIEGEDGMEFEEAALEAMEEKIQANADDSNAVAHTEKQNEVLLSRLTSGNLTPWPPHQRIG